MYERTRRPAERQDRTILVVDDEEPVALAHAEILRGIGYTVRVELDPLKVVELLGSDPQIGLVVLDLRMPSLYGIELLGRIKLRRPEVGVIIATVISDIEEAVRATKLGSYNYLLKPLNSDGLERAIESFFSNSPKGLSDDPRFSTFITQCPLFNDIFNQVRIFGEAEVSTLICGETGTGKELAAELLHRLSPRRLAPFVAVNAAALPSQLFESELFGYRRGAFTGALQDRAGLLESAQGGTLFLDEIGELPLEHQAKLLRVLQSRKFCRIGDTTERTLDVRFLFATNRDLPDEVEQKRFRADLFYRIGSHIITLPPLRSRTGDIEFLARYFLEKYRSQFGRSLEGYSDEALDLLNRYAYPGNVRELEGFISSAVLLERGNVIRPSSLPMHLQRAAVPRGEDLENVRYQTIMKVLAECQGNQTKAAERLGIARGTLNRLLKQFRNDG